MDALRFFSVIKDRKITLDIPPDFTSENVEIIILPLKNKKGKLKELLLEGPVWSEEDIEEIEKVSEGFRNWKIKEF